MYAVMFSNLELVRLLVGAGADTKAVNTEQNSALFYAEIYNKPEVFRYLKSAVSK